MKNIILLLILFCASSFAFSEEPFDQPRFEAKLIFGTSAFLDEDIPFDHSIFGGSIPIQLTPRLSVEPQFLYMKGPASDRDFTLTGNLAYDITIKDRFTLYVVGGGGLLHHTESFGNVNFSANEGTAYGGIGAKFFITNKLFVGSEFRFGWEPLMTATAAIGYAF